MYWESTSPRMRAHYVCLYKSVLSMIRASGRSPVPAHRASRHAWIDITVYLLRGRIRRHSIINIDVMVEGALGVWEGALEGA
jgi:hypothetical protein